MKLNLFRALTSVVAIPSLTYFPFKYWSQEESSTDSTTVGKTDVNPRNVAVDLTTNDNRNDLWSKDDLIIRDTVNLTGNFMAGVSFISSYLLFKFITTITRTCMILIVTCILV